jgi:pimeloyl-ACP methyl ester carboxylesterase/DNA-binding CsgD family transcriptional regulator
MTPPRQQIQFCTSRDDTRIAYAICGDGPPLVRALQWGTHLELDWQTPVWCSWLTALTRGNTLIRYDARGCGLSDGDVGDFSSERHLEDLEAVVNAAGLHRFALLGVTGGGPSSIRYAIHHPEQVSHLVLYGTYLRGRIARSTTPEQKEETETLLRLIEMGWERDEPSLRQLFSSQTIPEATADQFRSFNELMRKSASPSNAANLLRALHTDDISEIAPQVRCPTLVLHAREDARLPFEQGRALAAAIPNARFVPLDSRNHLILEQEPAWRTLLAELDAFLPRAKSSATNGLARKLDGLTAREHEVLDLVAQGIDNRRIAEQLHMGEKTVRNNVSNIMAKLGVRTRAEAIVTAREAGFGQASAG